MQILKKLFLLFLISSGQSVQADISSQAVGKFFEFAGCDKDNNSSSCILAGFSYPAGLLFLRLLWIALEVRSWRKLIKLTNDNLKKVQNQRSNNLEYLAKIIADMKELKEAVDDVDVLTTLANQLKVSNDLKLTEMITVNAKLQLTQQLKLLVSLYNDKIEQAKVKAKEAVTSSAKTALNLAITAVGAALGDLDNAEKRLGETVTKGLRSVSDDSTRELLPSIGAKLKYFFLNRKFKGPALDVKDLTKEARESLAANIDIMVSNLKAFADFYDKYANSKNLLIRNLQNLAGDNFNVLSYLKNAKDFVDAGINLSSALKGTDDDAKLEFTNFNIALIKMGRAENYFAKGKSKALNTDSIISAIRAWAIKNGFSTDDVNKLIAQVDVNPLIENFDEAQQKLNTDITANAIINENLLKDFNALLNDPFAKELTESYEWWSLNFNSSSESSKGSTSASGSQPKDQKDNFSKPINALKSLLQKAIDKQINLILESPITAPADETTTYSGPALINLTIPQTVYGIGITPQMQIDAVREHLFADLKNKAQNSEINASAYKYVFQEFNKFDTASLGEKYNLAKNLFNADASKNLFNADAYSDLVSQLQTESQLETAIKNLFAVVGIDGQIFSTAEFVKAIQAGFDEAGEAPGSDQAVAASHKQDLLNLLIELIKYSQNLESNVRTGFFDSTTNQLIQTLLTKNLPKGADLASISKYLLANNPKLYYQTHPDKLETKIVEEAATVNTIEKLNNFITNNIEDVATLSPASKKLLKDRLTALFQKDIKNWGGQKNLNANTLTLIQNKPNIAILPEAEQVALALETDIYSYGLKTGQRFVDIFKKLKYNQDNIFNGISTLLSKKYLTDPGKNNLVKTIFALIANPDTKFLSADTRSLILDLMQAKEPIIKAFSTFLEECLNKAQIKEFTPVFEKFLTNGFNLENNQAFDGFMRQVIANLKTVKTPIGLKPPLDYLLELFPRTQSNETLQDYLEGLLRSKTVSRSPTVPAPEPTEHLDPAQPVLSPEEYIGDQIRG